MSDESYQELHAQNFSRGQLIEEHERKIEAMEIQLKSSREQFEHQLKTLVDTKKELERIGVSHHIACL
jgi:kinesin family member 11